MKLGDKIILKGKSLKGKNRIGQHGKEWTVIVITPVRVLVKSADKTFKMPDGTWATDARWLDLPTDRDFEIVG